MFAFFAAGCTGAEMRPVFISDVSPGVAAPGMVLQIRGSGFSEGPPLESAAAAAAEPAPENEAEPEHFEVLVGGTAAELVAWSEDRIDVIVPAVEAGGAYVVIWRAGVASNAYPITILSTSVVPTASATD
jgi:uncharacterized protein (TIGR03437 family)